MGGLGPGIGGLEYLLIAAVALIVVGPERLPGLLRQLGKMIGKARRMADEFRSSFDEMARQSELDELRKEVEALRTNQGVVRLGAEADAAFKDIRTELHKPVDHDARAVMAPEPAVTALAESVEEWPESPPMMTPLATVAEGDMAATPAPKPVRKPRATAAKKATSTKLSSAKPRAPRKTSPSA